MEENQWIETLLFKNEIEYYKLFFEDIEVIEGLISDKCIPHTLLNKAIKKLVNVLVSFTPKVFSKITLSM